MKQLSSVGVKAALEADEDEAPEPGGQQSFVEGGEQRDGRLGGEL